MLTFNLNISQIQIKGIKMFLMMSPLAHRSRIIQTSSYSSCLNWNTWILYVLNVWMVECWYLRWNLFINKYIFVVDFRFHFEYKRRSVDECPTERLKRNVHFYTTRVVEKRNEYEVTRAGLERGFLGGDDDLWWVYYIWVGYAAGISIAITLLYS